jgi:1-aminocyclopropane-1-carboxylate deaminase/D-cysteine desulfhydrase-like pyridoxal-dependent ACC family enzyme
MDLANRFPFQKLIQNPTPVHALPLVGEWIGHTQLFVKREDVTAPGYGGNKVRNLEFILGAAIHSRAHKVVTLAPRGSNFIAALAAQAARIGMPVEVFQFNPASSALIDMQDQFTRRWGTKVHEFHAGLYSGVIGGELAMRLEPNAFRISPGGSSALGVLGHIQAVFELAEQIRKGEIPEPHIIVVGAGTCGTLAGLIAGVKLAGLRTQIIGVRCVDKIVCNRFRVARLANAALKLLGSRLKIRHSDVDLRDIGRIAYGQPLAQSDQLIRDVRVLSGIELDTTYTTKVFTFLRRAAAQGELAARNVLLWNTFSPAALQISSTPLALVCAG